MLSVQPGISEAAKSSPTIEWTEQTKGVAITAIDR